MLVEGSSAIYSGSHPKPNLLRRDRLDCLIPGLFTSFLRVMSGRYSHA